MIPRDRPKVIKQINHLLDNKCDNCPKRDELNKLHGSVFSRIDGYCNRECKVGAQLQELGRSLRVGERRVCEEAV